MQSPLPELASLLGIDWQGPSISVEGVCTDSRALTPDCLFVALKGDRFDGHNFIDQASSQAAACVVSQPVEASVPCLQVEDTLVALQTMAKAWRARFSQPVIAITGSCGKTSTRAIVSAILSTQGPVHASIKSYNNHIGVPLTLLGIKPVHQAVVAEAGTNGLGDIEALADMIQPTLSIITMAAPVHLDGLGSLAGIVQEKGALIRALKPGGVAVLNADDRAYEAWVAMLPLGVRSVSFSRRAGADISVTDWETLPGGDSRAKLTIDRKSVGIHVPLYGRHHASNVAAACAAAHALGISVADIVTGLETVVAAPSRMAPRAGVNGSWIIDDSFNANPVAVKAALEELMASPHSKRVMVLGDMLELADESQYYHEKVAAFAKKVGVHALLVYGDESRCMVPVFGDNAQHFNSHDELVQALRPMLDADTVVLIKGSHSMRMDVVVQACLDKKKGRA